MVNLKISYYDFVVGDVHQSPTLWIQICSRIPAIDHKTALEHFLSAYQYARENVMMYKVYQLRDRTGYTVLRYYETDIQRIAPVPIKKGKTWTYVYP